ncbi:hypothetical protein JHD47_00945 [Sulfurimonas sp. SAG-AH-194-L11]|nr:cache domain-containing protein [Sulfurimonas sp. SAG-AH-194-L11]MDF1876382.1 hypothetical protein [Sulfurimonas sp. SAG-AH-194-L11]
MKKIIFISLALLLYGVITFIYANYALKEEQKKSYVKLSHELKNELNNEKRFAKDMGIINAISIAENKDIKRALLDNNRDLAIKTLQKIEKDFADKTSVKHMKVHIHTKDTRAFVRSWKLGKFGDDLSGFRKAIVEVRITQEPFFGFEVGRMGLTLRSIVPILEDKRFIGSLEFIQNFDKIVRTFKRKEYSYLLLIDNSLLDIATYLKNAPKVGPYVLSSRIFDKEFLSASQKIDFQALHKDGYYISEQYFYTYEDIKDTKNFTAGIHLLAMPAKRLQEELNQDKSKIIKRIATQTLIIFLTLGVITLLYLLISSGRNFK